jgi:2-polyprenyl-6-methoxyphenol hydroxylase-like FAD-dependent oxidoreductase
VRVREQDGTLTTLRAGIVIGADGRHSAVASFARAEIYRIGKNASATLYAYFTGARPEGPTANHWYFRNDTGAGLIPTDGSTHLLFVSAEAAQLREALRVDPGAALRMGLERAAPELVPALANARQVGRMQGFGGQPGYFRKSHGPGFALVGDAGYFKDPITAHGISDALRDAELLARAVTEGSEAALMRYQEARDALSSELFEISDECAGFQWSETRIQQLHRQLSREMKRECEALLALGSVEPRRAA